MSITAARLEVLRSDTPGCTSQIHLNNAGAGLMPVPVLEAITAHLELESMTGGYEAAEAKQRDVRGAYEAVAGLLGTAARNVAFVENATVAFAQALSAVPFDRGDVLLTTTNDYVSNQIMFLSLARRWGIEVVRMPDAPTGELDLEEMRRLIRARRPKLVAVTHVPTNSGLVQPVEAVGRICRDEDVLFLLDACQSVGQRPIDVEAIGCDFLSATARKYLRGPRGAGFLYVADRVLESELEPLFIDMQGAVWTEPNLYARHPTAQRFENWEFAYALVLGTGAAARYATEVGIDAAHSRTSALAARLREGLEDAGIRILDRGPELCGIVTAEIPGREAHKFHAELQRAGVNAAPSTRAYAVIDFDHKEVEWAIRLSPHYYNAETEIDRAIEVVVGLARKGQ